LFPGIASYHQAISRELKKLSSGLSSHHSLLYEPVNHSLGSGGKLIRPILVLLGCKMYCDNALRAMHAATAIELFHNFTLIHDDIMDRSELRRKRPTVYKKWGSDTAILSGDAVLILAMKELEKIPSRRRKEVFDVFLSSALKVCEGQEMDMRFEKARGVNEASYLRMIECKTAVLLGASLQIGALIGGATWKESQKLFRYGILIGTAFQLKDDLLDVFGNKHKTGKQQGTDIRNKKKTWLWIRARSEGKDPGKIRNVAGVIRLYRDLHLDEAGKQKQDQLMRKASKVLETTKCSASEKKKLELLTQWLVTRDS